MDVAANRPVPSNADKTKVWRMTLSLVQCCDNEPSPRVQAWRLHWFPAMTLQQKKPMTHA